MAPFGILLHVPRATKKLDSFPREISSAISRPAEKRSYFDWKIGERLEGRPVGQRAKIIRMEEMVVCILFRQEDLLPTLLGFVLILGQKMSGGRTVNGSGNGRWNGFHIFIRYLLVARHFYSELKFYNM